MSASAAAVKDPVSELFDEGSAAVGPAWLNARRKEAIRRFRAVGVPHRRIEEWKYTDLRNALESDREVRGRSPGPTCDWFSAIGGPRLTVADGRCHASVSGKLPTGVELFDLEREDAPDWVRHNLGAEGLCSAMGEASLALMRGGIALRIAGGAPMPVHLRFVRERDAVHGRVLIVMESGASLVLLESHGAPGAGFANLGLEIALGPGARLTHVRLADTAQDAVQVEHIGVRVARAALYCGYFAQGGAKLSRLEIAIRLDGEGAEADVSGVGVFGDRLHADVTTHVDHVAGGTASRQLFKHVAGGNSRAVYQGKITVRKGADGSDSRQTAKAVLLGARAEVDLKPELEILADDVKCAHGAAVGDLDADSLFYLRARGIPETEARNLLLRGFLDEAVAAIAQDDVRRSVWEFVENGLGRAVVP